MQVTDEMVRVATKAFQACRPVERVACQDFGMQQDDILAQQLESALTAALGAMWRPISEAPKDGTEILLFTHQDVDDFCDEAFGAVQIGYWDDGNDAPGTVWHRDAGWILQKIGEPLAWQPLPSPPAQEG